MSTLAYIAGASVERNINEAIRTEEIRAHGAELQNLAYRFQAKIDELYEDNKRLRAIIDMKDMSIGQKKAELDKMEAKYKKACDYMDDLDVDGSAERMTSHVMASEVSGLLGGTLAEIVESAFKMNGHSVSEEVSRYIHEHATNALRFSSDSSLRLRFYCEFTRLLDEQRQTGKKFENSIEMAKGALEIADQMKAGLEKEAKKEVKGKGDWDSIKGNFESKKSAK